MKTQKKKQGGKGFYIVAMAVLLGAGLITAVSNNSKEQNKSEKTASESSVSETAEVSSEYSFEETTSEPIIKSEPSSSLEEVETTVSENDEPKETEEPEAIEEVAAKEVVTFQIPIDATIIKQFDLERHQYSKTFGDMRQHSGIDILAVAGTPVLITANGTVKSITQDPMMGTVVTLSHAGGYESIYCGLEDIKYSEGDKVKIGNVLGIVGEIPSEILDEDHLHFEIKKDGKSVSPLEVFNML